MMSLPVEMLLPSSAELSLNVIYVILLTLVIISMVYVQFLLAIVPIALLFLLLHRMSVTGVRNLKRLERVIHATLK